MSVSVKVSHAEKGSLTLQTDPQATVETFKRQVATKYGGHPACYQLSLRDKLLNDTDVTFESHNISDKDEITVTDCQFPVIIQGPFPICELSNMSVTRTTTVASIKEEIMKMYDYSSPKEFDLLYNGIALAGSNIEKHKIAENSTLIVTERIVALMELPKKKISIITPPVFSPKLKKKSLTSYDSMMNAVMALFSADTDNTLLRSCSMPDLISDSIEDSPAAIRNSLVSRKISVPASVFMMTSRNTGSKR